MSEQEKLVEVIKNLYRIQTVELAAKKEAIARATKAEAERDALAAAVGEMRTACALARRAASSNYDGVGFSTRLLIAA
jgi:hypothetical protein